MNLVSFSLFFFIYDHLEFHVNMEELWIFIMMHEKAYYYYATEFYKRVQGTLITDGVGRLDSENI